MTHPTDTTPSPKPKALTQTERVQARLMAHSTEDLIEQVMDLAGNPVFQMLEDSQDPSKVKTLAQTFSDPSTGGLNVYGTQLPMLDGFNELALDSTLLGSSFRKYQQGRKALATALEHMQKVDQKVQDDVVKRVNQIIRKQKGGASLVQNFHRHLRVGDLVLFSPGTPKNSVQFTSSGTFITLGLEMAPQNFDVSAELELLGDDFNELEAQRLLQNKITAHVAAMTNHLPTLAMASGLNADPNAVNVEGKPMGVNIHRLLTVTAQLWHGPSGQPARQWSLTQRGDGKYNSKKNEVLKFLPLVQSDETFPGAREGVLVITVHFAYRFKVKTKELDDVINGLGMLLDAEMPIYQGVEAGQSLDEHYMNLGISGGISASLTPDEDADNDDVEENVPDEVVPDEVVDVTDPQTPEADTVINSDVRNGVAEDVVEPDPQEPADGEFIMF